MASEVELTNWESEGLSADTQSAENGILTLKSTRYPLCIDPQMQAVKWLKKSLEGTLKVKSMNDDYAKWLEIAIKQGAPFLFENVTEDIDPMISPILEQNYQVRGNTLIVNLNGQELEVNENFKMFLVTKYANPK
jgi:dynein heavy chain